MKNLKLLMPFLALLSFSPILTYAEQQTISVDFGKLYEITYDAKDVTVSEVEPNVDEIELIFHVDVTSPIATLELTIPRDLLDSKENGDDIDFFIIADGELITFSEKESTETTRTLFIQLSPGTNEVEVFGTHLAEKTFEDESAVPDEDQPQIEETESESDEQPTEETVPETTEESMESPTETTEKEPEQQTTGSTILKLPAWSMDISKRQMTEFSVAAGLFLFLAIVIAAVKGSRSKQ
ncbi:MAG TPA: hypothetical protein VLB45_00525 [Nitrosopumilaceae archaeon]|nr:hypothetical protein [Nitrosopumilaceae archaeon]